jgi:hypothetical protein
MGAWRLRSERKEAHRGEEELTRMPLFIADALATGWRETDGSFLGLGGGGWQGGAISLATGPKNGCH